MAVNAANALVARGFDVHVTILGHRPIVYWVDPRIVFHSSSPVTAAFPASDAGSLDDELEQIAPVKTEGGESAKSTSLLGRYVKPYLHPRVLAFGLKTAGPVFSVIWQGRRTIWLRRTIRKIKPDAVLSFLTQTNILTVLATRGLATHTAISERNDPRLQRHRPRVEFMRRVVYPWADVVTANSKGALDALQAFVPEEKLAFLPNPLADAALERDLCLRRTDRHHRRTPGRAERHRCPACRLGEGRRLVAGLASGAGRRWPSR